MVAPLQSLIGHGLDVLSTVLSTTGRIYAYLGDVGHEVSESDKAKWIQHVGFASRPGKATPKKSACQCVTVSRSDGDIVIASSDSRTQEMYGALGEGETAAFAGGADGESQGRTLWKGDGSVNHYTRAGNTAGGAGMLLQLDAMNNAVRALNGAGFGLIVDPDGITLTVGAASLELKANGSIKLIGTGKVQIDGTSIVLGSAVVPGISNAIHGPSGMAGVASVKTSIE